MGWHSWWMRPQKSNSFLGNLPNTENIFTHISIFYEGRKIQMHFKSDSYRMPPVGGDINRGNSPINYLKRKNLVEKKIILNATFIN